MQTFLLPRDVADFVGSIIGRPTVAEAGRELASYVNWTALPPGVPDNPPTLTLTRNAIPDDGCE